MAAKCDHETSRLSCIECNSPICSSCLVQCPVGFRCKSCVGAVNRRRTGGETSPLSVAKSLALCTAVGCAGGWIMPFIRVPFLSCILCFFMGMAIGGWIAKFLDYKIGHRLGIIVTFGLLIGLSLSPCAAIVPLTIFMVSEIFAGHTADILSILTAIVSMIYCPVCFIIGVLRPTIWTKPY